MSRMERRWLFFALGLFFLAGVLTRVTISIGFVAVIGWAVLYVGSFRVMRWFTRGDVAVLRGMAQEFRPAWNHTASRFDSIADRIEALLPPETK
jgi:hypothetical protein